MAKKGNLKKETESLQITIVWIFQAVNKRNLTREDLDRAKKRETLREKLNLY